MQIQVKNGIEMMACSYEVYKKQRQKGNTNLRVQVVKMDQVIK
jgi:hypothetical protein